MVDVKGTVGRVVVVFWVPKDGCEILHRHQKDGRHPTKIMGCLPSTGAEFLDYPNHMKVFTGFFLVKTDFW